MEQSIGDIEAAREAERNPSASARDALDELKRCLDWLEHISEAEYSTADRKTLMAAADSFSAVARPIMRRYIDGEA